MSRRRRHGRRPAGSLWSRFGAAAAGLPRGRLAWAAEALGLVLLVLGTVYAMVSLRPQGIGTVRVEGSFRHVAKAEVRAALGERLQGDLWSLDLDALRDTLRGLPWVREATLRRAWPATLMVRIVERVPVARWNHGQLLDHNGEPFAIGGRDLPPDLPRLSGPAGSAARVLAETRRMAGILDAAGLGLAGVRTDARGAWFLELSNGIELVLGKGREREVRLRRFTRVYRAALRGDGRGRDPHRVAQVDLRYGNGFAVRRAAGPG
jgi:cell division protein FtsQ